MTIYLYIKTHNETGLKYLGKTKSNNPHTYKGSGDYWSNHIKKHGYDVTTEILKECTSNEEVKQWGLYYSNLWNIVEARDENGIKIWANLKPESGDGGAYINSGIHMKAEKYKELMRTRNADPEFLEALKHRMMTDNPMNNPESRNKIGDKLRGVPKSEEHKKNMFNPMTDPVISSKRRGTDNPRYDNTLYLFKHTSSTEEALLTQYEFARKYNMLPGSINNLVKRRCKSLHGWVISERPV